MNNTALWETSQFCLFIYPKLTFIEYDLAVHPFGKFIMIITVREYRWLASHL